MVKVSPIKAGLTERCPNCGEGRIWRGYLKFKPECSVCGQDFSKVDTADGPAFFVGFFILIVFTPFGFIFALADQSIFMKILTLLGLGIVSSVVGMLLLPKAKSLMMALEIAHQAKEAEFENKTDL